MNSSRNKRVAHALWGVAALAALAACSSPGSKGVHDSTATLSQMDSEMTRANESLKAAAPAAGAKGASKDDQVRDALLPPLSLTLPKAAADAVEPRFDLVVSKAPATQVFMALVANTPYSMLVQPDVAGEISVSLKNVTVKDALEALRDLYGYDFKINGNRIYVQSNAMQTRLFKVSYLAGKRTGKSDLRVTASSMSSSDQTSTSSSGTTTSGNQSTKGLESSQVSMSTETDFWNELKIALTAMVGKEGGRSIILNPMSGVVLVKGMPQDLRAVEEYLRATQLIIERQVMLEAKIIDVALKDEFQAGVNWAYFGGATTRAIGGVAQAGVALTDTAIAATGLAVQPGAGGGVVAGSSSKGFFGIAVQSDNFSSLIQFLETQGGVQVLSSPRVATLNNQKAVLKVGTDEYYVTNISTTTSTSTGGGSTTTPSITLSPFFSGISLDVTPQIDEGNNIILHVHPSVSLVEEKQKVIDLGTLGNFTLPLATSNINETDSIVRVGDGNIVAIGGLMKQVQSNARSQIPVFGDVPALGTLFGQTSKSLQKRELVILIKPTVIQGTQSWAPDLEETQKRIRDYNLPDRDKREQRDPSSK